MKPETLCECGRKKPPGTDREKGCEYCTKLEAAHWGEPKWRDTKIKEPSIRYYDTNRALTQYLRDRGLEATPLD